ncbi:HTH-type transcriptional repressor CsiR [Pseudovibrio axinellae]|uniref:HTH-type transcriptional repressor CsiR n=1 Tax=Pseudovibrio axinellae TaxID=989403 RepID=A0A165XYA4_9HYPH|nr:GntR family transcriptional regulator [Pseudovibrio axinellae]KZL18240.1 HTH-type transcriptional repressor CsiR [Pseudovibrio axinellae]SER71800.1 transcriptional regulator, GntR family [Pseudovibrio axinellae]
MKIEDTLERAAAPVTAQNAPSSASLIDRAYAHLRTAILSGQLEPGSKLRIREMCSSFDIGPTPVREALSRLVSQGLVATQSHKGFYIPELSQTEFLDIVEQRRLIEGATVRTAVEKGDTQWRERVLDAHHVLQQIERTWQASQRDFWDEWEEANRSFHITLIEGAGSSWALRFLHMLHDQCARYRAAMRRVGFVCEGMQEDHNQLMTAVRTGDGALAEQTIRTHLDRLPALYMRA